MGEGENHGIVPQFAKELFDRVEGTTDKEVTPVIMLVCEIHNIINAGSM